MSLPAPYYEHGGVTIYHGDCRAILPDLGGADVLITDPPYGVGFANYESHDDDRAGYGSFIWPALELAESRLPPGAFCAVFQSEVRVRDWATLIPRDFRLIAACKKFGQIGREVLMRQVDYVLYWRSGGWEWTRPDREQVKAWQPSGARNWCISTDACRTRERPDHPCPRPLDIMRFVVSTLAAPGSVVLDPFSGSGTTLLAAKELGRRAIGIELEEKYCEVAARRLSQEVLPLGGAAA